MAETLQDLYREVYGESAASRASREPARPRPNAPAAQRYNENRARARRNQPARDDFAARGHRQAFAPPRNQIAEMPQLALEMTGLPSVRRAAQHYTGAALGEPGYDVQQGNEQAVWGGLGVLGMAGLPRVTAPRPRAMPTEPPQRLTPPPREIGPNGMPIAPRQPFRNSLRGGSGDLMEAAQRHDAGSGGAGPSYLESLRAEGFDVDTTLYRGMTQPMRGERFEPTLGEGQWRAQGPGVSLTSDADLAGAYAEGGPVYEVAARGRLVDGDQFQREVFRRVREAKGERYGLADVDAEALRLQAEYRAQGVAGLRYADSEVRIFPDENGEVSNVALRNGSRTQLPDGGAAGRGRIRAYHGTAADVDSFSGGAHFGTEDAASRRLRDNRVTEGGRVYPVDLPQGNYLRVPEAGDQWQSARWWQEEARREIHSRIPPAERALWEAIEGDAALRQARGDAVNQRLGELFREHGFEGAIYRNRWEGGESYFMPDASRVSFTTERPNGGPSRPPDGAKSHRTDKPPTGGFFFGPRRR